MKNLLRSAAIAVASTALVAGGATAATAAPAAASTAATTTTAAASPSGTVTAAGFPLDQKSKIRVKKVGKKLTFRLTARFLNEFGQPVGIRKATIQVLKGRKWKTLKNVKLNSNGRGNYKKTDGKKRKYRMLIKPTSLYDGGVTRSVRI
ncbi:MULTISPECIES: hypothetical protein [Aeromicrobium]|uniref:hypothetical protein n=1 Tax=Aeromicrobium TaxID=2040 RepID=UPI0006FA9489|nr:MULTISPECIES: hypothetical protein [Aeromicrobium]KQX74559.1 hypothetical protein ASD10_04835 [Aeromicrobium sp. Root472D3]MCL8249956.1 hypothetical protein [Aeromicrobium fastidiosum]